jgi:hypothetical protein
MYIKYIYINMDKYQSMYIDNLLVRDDITDEVRDTAIAVKEGRAAIYDLYRAVFNKCIEGLHDALKAKSEDELELDRIRAIEDEEEREYQYDIDINKKNIASYAKQMCCKDPYLQLYIYLDQVSDKYLGDKLHESNGYRQELQCMIYRHLREALVDYMEADTHEIIFEIPKCILQDLLNIAFNSPNGEDDAEDYDYSILEDKLDNMDWGNDDNFEYIVIDNPGFINYNPEYWIPEKYCEFLDLYDHLFPMLRYEEAMNRPILFNPL